MKKHLLIIAIFFVSMTAFPQTSKFSVGLIGTHFHNDSNENRISKAENPYGYGIVLTDNITEDFSLAITGEYLKDNLEDNSGDEKDLRFHLSAIIHPFEAKIIRPYLVGGFVFTHRTIEYNVEGKRDKSKSLINGRFGGGVDIPIFANLFLNGDLGIYTDGFGFVGWGSTLGFRLAI